MRRPWSVTLAGIVLLMYGLGLLTIAALIVVVYTVVETMPGVPADVRVQIAALPRRDLIYGAIQLALGAPMLVAGIGVLRLRQWAWLLAVVVIGCNTAVLLVEYFGGSTPYLEMLVSALLTLWLNQREVHQAFRVEQHRTDPAGLLTAADDAAAAREAQRMLAERR